MTVVPKLIRCLREASPFRDLDAAWTERIAAHSVFRRLNAGEHVWRRGDAAQSVIVVEAGLVAVQRNTVDGDGVLVALFGPGDTLCTVPALQRIPFPADAIAVTDPVEVLVIAAAPLLGAIDHDPKLAAVFNRALLEHTLSLRSKIEIMTAGTVPRRIAALLLYLAERFGRNAGGGGVQIGPAPTREQIGQLVNARTETVIRVMSRWSKANWIRGTAPALQLLRTDMLQRIVDGPAGARQPDS